MTALLCLNLTVDIRPRVIQETKAIVVTLCPETKGQAGNTACKHKNWTENADYFSAP